MTHACPPSRLLPLLEPLEPRLLLTAGPVVQFVTINDGYDERSSLAKIGVCFDADISASLSPDDLVMTRSDTGQAVDLTGVSPSWNAATNTATWNLAGLPSGRITDGFYRVRLVAPGITDSAGHPLDGNRDGTAGDDFEWSTFQKAGDVNGDGTVDAGDLTVVQANLLKLLGQFDPRADLNLDGKVNALDLLVVRQNWQTALQPPTPLMRADSLADVAAALYFKPEKIYEFVLNNFRYEPYTGLMKGATATLQTRAGNDWDQSALLAGLLTEAGVYCRFVSAKIEAPAQTAMDYLGAKDAGAAGSVLANAGLGPTSIVDGSGHVVSIRFDHAWIQSYLPDSSDAYAWKDMDGAWKFRSFQAGVPDLITLVPFNEADYLSQTRKELAYEYYEDEVSAYLAAQTPGESLSDVPYDGPIIPQQVGAITGVLPYTVYSTPVQFTQAPSTMKHRVYLRLTDGGDTTYLDQLLTLPDMCLQRVTISYADAGGGQLRPQLRLDGLAAAQSPTTVAPGANVVLSLEHLNGDGDSVVDDSTSYNRSAGDYIAVGLDAGQITDALLTRQQAAINAASIARQDGQAYAQDDLIGGVLARAVWGYFNETRKAERLIGGLTDGIGIYARVASGLVTSKSTTQYFPQLQNPYLPVELYLDVANGVYHGVSLDHNTSVEDARRNLVLDNKSAQEHAIWEEVAQTTGMSTIKSLQRAHELGIPVVTITPSWTESQIRNTLQLSTGLENEIVSRVLGNNETVTIPVQNTPLNDWDGLGYIANWSSGGTFTWAYIINGALAGGTAQSVRGGYTTSLDPDFFWIPDLGLDQPTLGDPINAANGNVTHEELDVSLPGAGLGLEFGRCYNSTSSTDVGFGPGWTYSYGDFLTFNGDGSVTWTDSTGIGYTFAYSGGGYIVPQTLHGTFTSAAGLYTFRNKDGLKHVFDSSGRLVEIRDRDDNALTMSYAGGKLVAVIDADAPTRRLTFTYSGGLIASMSDFTGRAWTYGYSSGRLSSVTTPSDGQTPLYTAQYAYYTDPALAGLLSQITQADGGVIHYEYYANRRGFRVTDPEGNSHHVSWNIYRSRAIFTDERGYQALYEYNDQGNLVRQVHPDGAVESWTWANSLMTSHTDPMGKTETFAHDALGNVTTFFDKAGHTSAFTYEPVFSQMTRSDLPGGRTTRFAYDARGNLTQIEDALGGLTRMTYDGRGLMLTLTDPRGTATPAPGDCMTTYTYNDTGRVLTRSTDLPSVESFTYDSRGNLLTSTDADGHTATFAYDLMNRVIRTEDALGGVATMTYAPLAGVASMTDPLGRTTTYAYDLNERLVRTVDAAHGITWQTYDPAGNLVAREDALGRVTQYAYDPRNRPVSVLYADGAAQASEYDGAGRLVERSDELGRVTRYAYDTLGRLLQVTDAMGQVAGRAYDAAGNLVSSTDRDGHATQYAYDLLDRRIGVTDALSHTTTTAYDAVGNVLSVTDPLGRTMHYAYDVLGRLTGATDPLGHTSTTAYDAVGNVLSVTDPLGNATQYAYDALNRRVAATDALGRLTATACDAVGNALSITDADGNVTRYSYDALNRVTAETNALGASRTYRYDAVGNLTGSTDRDGRSSRYTYDPRNRQTAEVWLGGGGAAIRTIARTYDAAGELLTVTDPDTAYAYTYDALGRVASVSTGLAVQTATVTQTYSGTLTTSDHPLGDGSYYDIYTFQAAAGDTIVVAMNSTAVNAYLFLFPPSGASWQDDDGGGGTNARIQVTAGTAGTWTVWANSWGELGAYTLQITHGGALAQAVLNYAYDPEGNGLATSDNLGGTTAYAYDAVNRVILETQSGAGVTDKRADFAYTAAGQLATITRYSDLAGTQLVASSSYAYDGAARLTGLTHARGGTTLAAYSWTWDAANRITRMTSPDGASDFAYDSTSQLTGADHSYQGDENYAYDPTGNRTNTGYATGADNRLLSDGTYAYQYDAEGNRTRRTRISDGQVTQYEWDYRNRLTRVVTTSAGGTVLSDARYTYDAFGRRVSKWVDADGAGPGAAVTERYVYDGQNIILVVSAAGAATHRYFHGPGVDQILADQSAGGAVAWALADHLGTVRDVVNSSGVVLDHIKYDAFGRVTAESNPAAAILYGFTGRERDTETGLDYYRARYYDPGVGRFVSEDPIRFRSGDTNLYRYANNNPIVGADPFGLRSSTVRTDSTGVILTGSEAEYIPWLWNIPLLTQPYNNCYAYAMNDLVIWPFRTSKPQPGDISGNLYDSVTVDSVRSAATSDGLIYLGNDPASTLAAPPNSYIVALVVDPLYPDYHWYRHNPDGTWSHKPGGTPATNVDASGNPITDPRTANRDAGPGAPNYTNWGGYFAVPTG
jgi:RHS repeat-associated protein